MSKAPAEASNIGIGSGVSQQQRLVTNSLATFLVVEPYMITLKEDAEAFTGFQHSGMEFIYMLTGEVIYRHGDNTYRLRPGDSIVFDSGALHGPESLVKRPMTYLSIIVYPRT
jgi:mannose-6-phosphate isomerase-like protein (cupin superfamily)